MAYNPQNPNGQATSANSAPVVVASDQSTLPVSAASLPLPTGAATAANQTTANASLSSIDGKTATLVSGRVPVDGSGVTQPVSGTVTANAGSGTFAVSATSLPLPTGAATSANQTTANTSLNSIDGKLGSLGQKTMAGSAPVVLASDQSTITVSQVGRTTANAPIRRDYSTGNVTTGAYVQLVASLTTTCSEIEIFDSSGQTLFLATGGAGSEVDQILIFPGGNGRIPLRIAAGTRISIKAVSATANTGEIDLNFYA